MVDTIGMAENEIRDYDFIAHDTPKSSFISMTLILLHKLAQCFAKVKT